jgi:hypothetical protein
MKITRPLWNILMRDMKNDNKLRGSPSAPFTRCYAAGSAAVVFAWGLVEPSWTSWLCGWPDSSKASLMRLHAWSFSPSPWRNSWHCKTVYRRKWKLNWITVSLSHSITLPLTLKTSSGWRDRGHASYTSSEALVFSYTERTRTCEFSRVALMYAHRARQNGLKIRSRVEVEIQIIGKH